MKLEINDPSVEECFKMLNAIEEAYTIDVELTNGQTLRDYVVYTTDTCYGTIDVGPFGTPETLRQTFNFGSIETLKVNIG